MQTITKILVANRGEIAVRVIKTAQSLGYDTVAVYSEADADAPHVRLADQAVLIGPPDVNQSYLHIDNILEAVKKSGADAVHPGYGFLSENPTFARRIIEQGSVWIGPPPDAMEIMGNKAAAKMAVEKDAGKVPTVPGYAGEDQSDDAFMAAADKIGYPIMVKAAAGGGGRGMRLVPNQEGLAAALSSARSEAQKAFGSGELLLEKGIVNPRHIEVQVFGDQQGNVIHLGERDCSIQRRHQKVVEEAPSPAVSDSLRAQLGEAAVNAAKAVGYYGAGTVEFLLDEAGSFYFMEMNTRLQVEHPVTEMITGQDLVAWQIAVAEGQPLPFTQDEVELKGHSIEVRLYAEDPHNQFLPSTGDILLWQPPAGDGVRVDHGLRSGMTITPFYDAMVAKIITWGPNREIARRRLKRALAQTAVFGVTTNRQFLIETIEVPAFISGNATTSFIETYWQPAGGETSTASPKLIALASLLHYLKGSGHDQWPGFWKSRAASFKFDPQKDGAIYNLVTEANDQFCITISEAEHQIKLIERGPTHIRFDFDGVQEQASYTIDIDGGVALQCGPEMEIFYNYLMSPPESGGGAGSGKIISPMPGSVMRLNVAVGDEVKQGDTLLILEAMKMEHAITAPIDGTVSELLVTQGQQMKPKELMLVITNGQLH